MLALIGQKKSQSQKFLENGMRIPVTLIDVKNNWVISHKTNDRDHYQAVQLGFGIKKTANRAQIGHAKGAKLEKAPKFLKEVRIIDDSPLPEVGSTLNPSEVFSPGDIVDVSGFSKGKGYAGVVKRHGFHGGPKTHGQSDRHRAPGAIGQGTTPGRVYKGKRMAGRMGNENVTVSNLKIIDVTNDGVLVIKGLVPGIINSLIVVKKTGEDKKFVPLWKAPEESPVEDSKVSQEVQAEPQTTEEKAEPSSAEASEGQGNQEESAGPQTEAAPVETSATETNNEQVEAAPADDAISKSTEESSDAQDSEQKTNNEEVKDGDK